MQWCPCWSMISKLYRIQCMQYSALTDVLSGISSELGCDLLESKLPYLSLDTIAQIKTLEQLPPQRQSTLSFWLQQTSSLHSIAATSTLPL